MTKKIEAPPVAAASAMDRITKAAHEHAEMVKLILDDNLIGGDILVEIDAAADNLIDRLADISVDLDDALKTVKEDIEAHPSSTAEKLIEIVGPYASTGDAIDLLTAMYNNNDCLELGEILDGLAEEDAVRDWLTSKGYVLIKTASMVQRQKIEDFVKEEIYPFGRDQESNLFL